MKAADLDRACEIPRMGNERVCCLSQETAGQSARLQIGTCGNLLCSSRHYEFRLIGLIVVLVLVVVVALTSLARIFGRSFKDSFPAYVFFSFFSFLFLKWILACGTLIPLFMPGSVYTVSAV